MRLRFNTFNHSDLGRRSIEDVIDIIGQQLRALGHEVEWDDKRYYEQGFGLNIIFESFNDVAIEELKRAHDAGCRFLMIATEEPTEKGFNYGATLHLRQRQEWFPRAAELCEGILHLIPGEDITRWYGQFAPAAQAELGWSPGIMKREANPNPRWDFGFFGGLTPRRNKIIHKLNQKTGGGVRTETMFRSQEERDAAMQTAKVIVQIRGQEYLGLVSSSRCVTSLALGRPVVAEPHKLSKPWDEVVTFARTLDEFYTLANLTRSMWRGVYQKQLERFRTKLPPEVCWGEPLRKIGLRQDLYTPGSSVRVAAGI